MVARRAHNPKVAGSSPALATKNPSKRRVFYLSQTLISCLSFTFLKVFRLIKSTLDTPLISFNGFILTINTQQKATPEDTALWK